MGRTAFNRLALAATVAFSLLAARCGDNTIVDGIPYRPDYSEFMPLAVGNWWEYQVTVETMASPPRIYKVKYEITEQIPNYKGRLAYVIEVTEDGKRQPPIIAAGGRGVTYLDRGYWAVLIWDAIAEGDWTQTGLVVDFPLQCIGRGRCTVPAGRYDCVTLALDNENELTPESWRERYAEKAGLIEYENYYKEYDTSIPPQLVDWREVKYELTDYDVHPGLPGLPPPGNGRPFPLDAAAGP